MAPAMRRFSMETALSVRGLDRLIVVGWMVAVAVVRAGTITEADPYWQIRAGLENLDGMPLARPDTWSWAPVDGLFYPNSPAWNIILALGWRAGGFWGIFALTAGAILAELVVIGLLARSMGARPLPFLAVLIPITILAFPGLSPRATIVAQTLLLAAVGLAHWWSRRAGDHSAAVNAVVVGLAGFVLSLAGNWIHLSWLTWSLVTAGAWLVLWSLTPALGAARRVAMVAAGTLGLLLGMVWGPYGLGGWERSAAVYAASAGLIAEWTTSLDTAPLALATAAVAALSAGTLAWAVRRTVHGHATDPTVRLAAVLALLALPTAVAGLWGSRFTYVALALIAPVAAAAATAAASRLRERATREPRTGVWRSARVREWTTAPFWRTVLGWVLVALTPLVVIMAWPHAQPRITDLAPAVTAGCRVFGPQEYVDPLILLRPDVTVWIDGRVDYYGRERGQAFQRYYFASTPDEPVPPGTQCVIVPAAELDDRAANLAALLGDDPGWELAASRRGLELWVARPSTPPAD